MKTRITYRRPFGFIAWLLLAALTATAQSDSPQAPSTDASPTPSTTAAAFDAITIKPNKSGRNSGAWGVSQNKYFAKNTPLGRVILQAYLGFFDSTDRLKGAPPWVMTEPYDITAKVDDATADKWKGLKQAQQVALAAPLLRAMLEDRCKLIAHTEPTEIAAYALVIGKHGSKLKVAQPDEPKPTANFAVFEGGWMMVYSQAGESKQSNSYLQVTMAQFTQFLSLGGKPLIDQTGLSGKYDFDLPRFETILPPPAEGPADGPVAPPAPPPDIARLFDWNAVGLEVKPIKVPASNLVIDHIERPSEN